MKKCKWFQRCVSSNGFSFYCRVDGHIVSDGDECQFEEGQINLPGKTSVFLTESETCENCLFGDDKVYFFDIDCSLHGKCKMKSDWCPDYVPRRR